MHPRTLTCLVLALLLWAPVALAAEDPKEGTDPAEPKKDDAAESPSPAPQFTEEVEVTARAPEEVPTVSPPSVFVIDRATIEKIGDYDLAKPFLYTTGTYVSTGTKNEAGLQIRGLGSGKVALLYDGVPVYEPYFGSFDLNSITAEEVESVKILKGTTSVLYGPNALGGAVNVMTKRPTDNGGSAVASYGSFGDTGVAATGTARSGRLGFVGSVSYHSVDDFEYTDDAGESVTRTNSDYETRNLTGKVYCYPAGGSSEIVVEAGHVTSEYGIPWATELYSPRYWRFSDWDRWLLSAGATLPLAGKGHLKARGYYVKHHNVLDAYADEDLTDLEWQSTFDNDSVGTALQGSVELDARNELRFSAHAKDDRARTRDDVGEEWEEVSQQTFSLGAEDHWRLSGGWTLMAGASADHLNKEDGEDQTAFNPIVGARYSPAEHLVVSATFSQKSRFPTMKDLYSSTTGNPDLREERSTNWEAGLAWKRGATFTGSVFHSTIRDLVLSIRREDGSRVPINVGRARITGFELGVRKEVGRAGAFANYTYLDSADLDTGRELPLVPRSQFNLGFDLLPRPAWRLSLWGTGVFDIQTEYRDEVVDVPDYFVANAGVSRTFGGFEVFARVENLLDAAYVTEPGFPMPGRAFRLALRLATGRP